MSEAESSQIIEPVLQDLNIKSFEVLQLNDRSASLKVERFGATRFLKILMDRDNLQNIEQDMLLHNFLSFMQDQQPELIFRVPKILAYDKNWYVSEFFDTPNLLPVRQDAALDTSFTPTAFRRHLDEIVQLFVDTDITIGWHGRSRPLYVDTAGKPNGLWRSKRKEIAAWNRTAISAKLLTKNQADQLTKRIEDNLDRISIAWEHGELWPSNLYRHQTAKGEPKIGLIDFDKGKMFGARFFDVVRMFIILYSKFGDQALAHKFLREYVLRQSISAEDFTAASLPLLIMKQLGTAHDMSGLLESKEGRQWRQSHRQLLDILLSDDPGAVFGL